jgi:hypothetical protein
VFYCLPLSERKHLEVIMSTKRIFAALLAAGLFTASIVTIASVALSLSTTNAAACGNANGRTDSGN